MRCAAAYSCPRALDFRLQPFEQIALLPPEPHRGFVVQLDLRHQQPRIPARAVAVFRAGWLSLHRRPAPMAHRTAHGLGRSRRRQVREVDRRMPAENLNRLGPRGRRRRRSVGRIVGIQHRDRLRADQQRHRDRGAIRGQRGKGRRRRSRAVGRSRPARGAAGPRRAGRRPSSLDLQRATSAPNPSAFHASSSAPLTTNSATRGASTGRGRQAARRARRTANAPASSDRIAVSRRSTTASCACRSATRAASAAAGLRRASCSSRVVLARLSRRSCCSADCRSRGIEPPLELVRHVPPAIAPRIASCRVARAHVSSCSRCSG